MIQGDRCQDLFMNLGTISPKALTAPRSPHKRRYLTETWTNNKAVNPNSNNRTKLMKNPYICPPSPQDHYSRSHSTQCYNHNKKATLLWSQITVNKVKERGKSIRESHAYGESCRQAEYTRESASTVAYKTMERGERGRRARARERERRVRGEERERGKMSLRVVRVREKGLGDGG